MRVFYNQDHTHAHKIQKAVLGRMTKSNVFMMIQISILEDIETIKVQRQCRCFKVKKLNDHKTFNAANTK